MSPKEKKVPRKQKNVRRKPAKSARSVARIPVQRERRKEQRVQPRLPICARVSWGSFEDSIERYFFTRNVSASGAFLLSDSPPPIGERIDMEISIQYSPQPIAMSGKVVRHEADAQGRAVGCGVHFSEPNPQMNNFIDALVAQEKNQ